MHTRHEKKRAYAAQFQRWEFSASKIHVLLFLLAFTGHGRGVPLGVHAQSTRQAARAATAAAAGAAAASNLGDLYACAMGTGHVAAAMRARRTLPVGARHMEFAGAAVVDHGAVFRSMVILQRLAAAGPEDIVSTPSAPGGYEQIFRTYAGICFSAFLGLV